MAIYMAMDSGSVEWLDIVDADDRVVGAAPRAEVHARRLMHRSCHMLVVQRDGRVLLQRRSERKDNNPGLWDTSAAGHVDRGEPYLDAARRELREELGVELSGAAFCPRFRLPPVSWTGLEHVAVYTVISDGPFTPDPAEVAELSVLEPVALQRWMAAEPERFTRIFREICRRLGIVSSTC